MGLRNLKMPASGKGEKMYFENETYRVEIKRQGNEISLTFILFTDSAALSQAQREQIVQEILGLMINHVA